MASAGSSGARTQGGRFGRVQPNGGSAQNPSTDWDGIRGLWQAVARDQHRGEGFRGAGGRSRNSARHSRAFGTSAITSVPVSRLLQRRQMEQIGVGGATATSKPICVVGPITKGPRAAISSPFRDSGSAQDTAAIHPTPPYLPIYRAAARAPLEPRHRQTSTLKPRVDPVFDFVTHRTSGRPPKREQMGHFSGVVQVPALQ